MTSTEPPQLPQALVAQGIGLRAARDDDRDFLRDVYTAYRWDELEPAGWPRETRLAFLADQFRLQHLHYSTYYPGAAFCVVEAKGERAGRLYLYRVAGDLRIVDIAFLPAWRNRGIGGGLIAAVQAQARDLGIKVSIHVEQNNPAQSLYARLGFVAVGEAGIYKLLEWRSG